MRTIQLLLGLLRPTERHRAVLGEPISAPRRLPRPRRRADRGAVLLSDALGAAQPRGADAPRAHPRARASTRCSSSSSCSDRGGDLVRTYSLGMKQRLGVAAALLPNPELCILDEPTNGLDPAGIREMRAVMRGLADRGITVFVSSHLLAEIQAVCDHLVMIDSGRIVFQGAGRRPARGAALELARHARARRRRSGARRPLRRRRPAGARRGRRVHVQAPEELGGRAQPPAMAAGITLRGLDRRARLARGGVLRDHRGDGGRSGLMLGAFSQRVGQDAPARDAPVGPRRRPVLRADRDRRRPSSGPCAPSPFFSEGHGIRVTFARARGA